MPANGGQNGKGRAASRISPQSRGNEEQLRQLLEKAKAVAGTSGTAARHGGGNVRVASPRRLTAAETEAAVAPKGEPEQPFKGFPPRIETAAAVAGEHLPDAWHATYSTALAINQLRQRTPMAESAMEVVLADDDREQITDTTAFPWRCICHLVITAPDNSRWVGTGWLASPRLVITAGHCVFLYGAGGWARQIEVYPGRNGTSTPFGSLVSSDLRSVSRWTEEQDAEYDYGAIRLPESTAVGFFGYAALTDAELREALVNVYGYPADKQQGTLWGSARKLSQVQPRTLVYNISTYGGQSGCPVFLKEGEDRTAAGIHNYGDLKGNSATRITADVYDDIEAWKAEAP